MKNTNTNEKIYGIMVKFLYTFLLKNSYIWKHEYSISELKDLACSAISSAFAQGCSFDLEDFLDKDKENLVKRYLTSHARKETKLYRSFQSFKSMVDNRVKKGKLLEIKHNRFSVTLFPERKGVLLPGNTYSIYRQIKSQKDAWFTKRQIIMAHLKGRDLEERSVGRREDLATIRTRLRDIVQIEHCKTTQTDAKGQQMLFAAIGWFSANGVLQMDSDDEALVSDLGLVDRIYLLWNRYFPSETLGRSSCFGRLKDFKDYLYRYLKDLSESDRRQALKDVRCELECYYKHVRDLIPESERAA